MNKSPGIRYQYWPAMFVVFFMIFLPASYLLMQATWNLFEDELWGDFSIHSTWLLSAVSLVSPFGSADEWQTYWQVLVDNGLHYVLIAHAVIPILVAALVSYFIVKKVLWVEGGRENVIHIKGPKLMFGALAILHAKAMHKLDLKADKRSGLGINVHPEINISTTREQTNYCILGTTGGGKPMVDGAIKRGDFALIYDEKGEYTKDFYVEESTVLIAPWDSRGMVWNIARDVTNKQEAYLMAGCMIPISGEKDKVWVKGAQLLFIGMIMSLIKTTSTWGWADLYRLLKTPQDEMLELLKNFYPIASTFIQEESKTTQGFYINLIGELNWIEDLALAWPKPQKNGFSIKQWVQNESDKKVVIIQSDARYDAIGAPLCNSIISLMTRFYLALEEGVERRTWLFIDEFANLPVNPSIQKWLELARSRGARSVLCTQSISQLRELYGNNRTDAILNLLSIVISLRMGAGGDDAIYASKMFAERLVERPSSTEPTASWQRSYEPLVESFELTQLKPASWRGVEGFLSIPGWNATYKLRWPLFLRKPIATRHCPADWLKDPSQVDKLQKKKINKLNKRGL
jgi:hypothetical protein